VQGRYYHRRLNVPRQRGFGHCTSNTCPVNSDNMDTTEQREIDEIWHILQDKVQIA